MRGNWLRLCGYVFYMWLAVMIVTVMGCAQEDSATASAPKPTSVVAVETYTRADGRAPGMELTCTVTDDSVGVNSITLQYGGDMRDGAYMDLCCAWYRVEDMWGVTWYGQPKGTALTVCGTTPAYVLTRGTWVAHMFFLGEKVPVVQGVSLTEIKLK